MLLRYPYEVRSEKANISMIFRMKDHQGNAGPRLSTSSSPTGSVNAKKVLRPKEEWAGLQDRAYPQRPASTTAKAAPKSGGNVINLMDALKLSLASEKQAAPQPKGKKLRKRIEGQL